MEEEERLMEELSDELEDQEPDKDSVGTFYEGLQGLKPCIVQVESAQKAIESWRTGGERARAVVWEKRTPRKRWSEPLGRRSHSIRKPQTQTFQEGLPHSLTGGTRAHQADSTLLDFNSVTRSGSVFAIAEYIKLDSEILAELLRPSERDADVSMEPATGPQAGRPDDWDLEEFLN
ncbi:hypothetical protein B0H10DRAFT_1959096 [Mycena sp. CBHHK59/15]|nr:hypothetical protein B0H10DRAFT_1959096 [Mycena sp. CBHHK59/15]